MDDTILWWGKKKDRVLREKHPHLTDFLLLVNAGTLTQLYAQVDREVQDV
jgi:hypothetical protein